MKKSSFNVEKLLWSILGPDMAATLRISCPVGPTCIVTTFTKNSELRQYWLAATDLPLLRSTKVVFYNEKRIPTIILLKRTVIQLLIITSESKK